MNWMTGKTLTPMTRIRSRRTLVAWLISGGTIGGDWHSPNSKSRYIRVLADAALIDDCSSKQAEARQARWQDDAQKQETIPASLKFQVPFSYSTSVRTLRHEMDDFHGAHHVLYHAHHAFIRRNQ